MPQQTKEEQLKSEFWEFCESFQKRIGTDSTGEERRLYLIKDEAMALAEFWLSKLSSYKSELKEMVDGIMRKYVSQPAEYKGSDANVWREGYNAACERFINLIETDGK